MNYCNKHWRDRAKRALGEDIRNNRQRRPGSRVFKKLMNLMKRITTVKGIISIIENQIW